MRPSFWIPLVLTLGGINAFCGFWAVMSVIYGSGTPLLWLLIPFNLGIATLLFLIVYWEAGKK